MRCRWLLAGALLACCAVPAATARGDGLPVLGIVGAPNGVRSLDGSRRYAAQLHAHSTTVKAIDRSGAVLSRVVPGRFDVPVVAYDGTPSGLSANGRTLVLIRPRRSFPQRSTELAILDANTLRLRALDVLQGDFSFDAISPAGAWVYLIQYTSAVDPTEYRVRALEARTGRLLAADIVDPHDRGERMRGNPLTRVSSPDGRWAYTLYDGNGHPFVHALDTAARRARCIDVTGLPTGADVWSARLALTGTRLRVVLGAQVVSQIDTRSLSEITPPVRPSPHPEIVHATARVKTLWAVLPIGAFAVMAIAIVVIRRRMAPAPRPARPR